MLTRVYPKSMWKFLIDGFRWVDNQWRVIVCSAAYTYGTGHEFVSDLGEAIVGRSGCLTDKWFDLDGVTGETRFGAADVILEQYLAGSTAVWFILYCDTGDDASSRILGHWEIGRDVVLDGGDFTISFPGGVVLSVGHGFNTEHGTMFSGDATYEEEPAF